LVAKLKELFSELKANGKLDAAKHLDLLTIKCFSRDTLVHTATGPRPIGEIEPGEQIWSYHFERGGWGLCEVKERLDNTYSGPVVSITVDNTTIEATAYHPFWVIDGRDLQERSKPRELQEHEDEGHSLPGRWVNSHELRAGDCIITRSGTRAVITEIRQRFDDAFPVSNLSIIGHHNYAVGDVGVLVHNITVCEETIKDLRKLYADGKGKSPDELRELLRSQKNDKGESLYNESEIDEAMEKILETPEMRKYREYWEGKGAYEHSNQSSPFSIKKSYHPDGNVKTVTTYDQHGNAHRQYGVSERGHDFHQHRYETNTKKPNPRRKSPDPDSPRRLPGEPVDD
jgi:hypothetical protein